MTSPAANPYVGPRTFTTEQAHLFFGREAEAAQLLAVIISERLTLFYAQSGAGKSSVLHARLIPNLKAAGILTLPVGRVSGQLPPGVSQVDNIFAFNLMTSLDNGQGDPNRFSRVSLSHFLARLTSRDGRSFYYDEQASPLAVAPAHSPDYVLIIDQFEEILTSYTERWPERADFFQQLDQAMAADPLLRVVLTLREDYVAGLDPYSQLLAGKLRARFYMQRMGYDAALEAVKNPAQAFDRPFAPGVAENLVDNLRQIRSQTPLSPSAAGGSEESSPWRGGLRGGLGQYVEPVQLQVVCYQLWQNLTSKDPTGFSKPVGSGLEITAADLATLGNVDSALAEFYEGTLQQTLAWFSQNSTPPPTPPLLGEGRESPPLSWKERGPGGLSELTLRRWFDDELITEAGTRGVVFQGPHDTAGLPNEVVKRLADHYLLRAEMRAGGTWYELVHDRLVEPIQQANQKWEAERLQRNPLAAPFAVWQNDPGKLLDGAQLAAAAAYTEANPQDVTEEEQEFLRESQHREAEREKEAHAAVRRRQIYASIALVIIAVLAGLTIWALQQQTEAIKQANTAATAEAEAKIQAEIAQQKANEAAIAQAEAETQRAIAETARTEAEHQTRQARLALAYQLNTQAEAIRSKKPELSLLLSIKALQQIESPREITLEQALRETLTEFTFSLVGHTGGINTVTISPNGHWLATAGDDYTTRLWNLASTPPTAASITLWGHPGAIKVASFSPDDHWLATSSTDGTVRLWDITAPNPASASIRLLDSTQAVTTLAFSPNNRWLVVGSEDGLIHLWDITTPEHVMTTTVLTGHEASEFGVTALAISPDGRWLVTGGGDGTLFRWNLTMPDIMAHRVALPGHTTRVNALAISPDSRWLVTGAAASEKGGEAYRYDLINPAARPFSLTGNIPNIQATGIHPNNIRAVAISSNSDKTWVAIGGDDTTVRLRILSDTSTAPIVLRQPEEVNQIIFSPDNHWLITGCGDGKIRRWDLIQPELEPLVLSAYDDPVAITAMALDRSGRWLVAGSASRRTLRLWDLSSPENSIIEPVILPEESIGSNALAVTTDSRWLMTAGWSNSIQLWDLDQPRVVSSALILPHANDTINTLAISPDNHWLAAGAESGRVYRWDLTQPDIPAHTWPAHSHSIKTSVITPDQHWLVTATGDDATIHLWDLKSAVAGPSLKGHIGAINALAISSDNHQLISGGEDQIIRGWRLNNLAQPASAFITPTLAFTTQNRILALAVSPNNRWLASSHNDGTVRLWNMTNLVPDPERILRCQNCIAIRALAISPDNRWLLAGADDAIVRLWDLSDPDANPLLLTGHKLPITAVAISPNKHWLISGSPGEGIRLWTLPFEDLLQKACRGVGRNMTNEEWNVYFPGQDYQPICSEFSVPDTVRQAVFQKIDQTPASKKETAYATAVTWVVKTSDVEFNHDLCWRGSLDGFAATVLPTCERALILGPVNGWLYTSRGVARAMLGDTDQAVSDFKAAVEWFRQNNLYEVYGPLRETWITELTDQRNPFADPAIRQAMQSDPRPPHR